MKKLVLILTGGGAKGAFQAGVWNRILKDGVYLGDELHRGFIPSAIFGVSAGALNGAMIAMGKNKELFQLWQMIAGFPAEIYASDFLKTENQKTILDADALGRFLFSDVNLLQKMGLLFKGGREKVLRKVLEKLKTLKALADNEPLAEKLKVLLTRGEIKSEVFQPGFVSLTDGGYYSFKHSDFDSDEDFQSAVLASSSVPLVWPPVEKVSAKGIEVSHLIDGGLRTVNPLGDAVRYACEAEGNHEYYFLIVSCHTGVLPAMQESPNLRNIVQRSIYDIALNEIRDTDLSEFLRVNALVKQAQERGFDLYSDSGRKLKAFNVKIIQPSRELAGSLDFSRSAVMDAYTHGFLLAGSVAASPNWG